MNGPYVTETSYGRPRRPAAYSRTCYWAVVLATPTVLL